MTTSAYENWLDVYGDLYKNRSLLAIGACLNCGTVGQLEVVFVVRESERGSCRAYFWCGKCLTGIGPLRAPLPDSGWPFTPHGTENIPNYSLVSD
jgi:hypothetical protein